MTIVLGLTGSYGSGKSTVAAMLAEMGIPVIDADEIAREVVRPGAPALAEIVAAFGGSVLKEDGTLDRARLAEVVFAEEGARRRLNAIVHPRVGERLRQFVRENAAAPVVALEIPLLLEGGGRGLVDQIVVVTVKESTRMERLARRGIDESSARARLASQLPQERKVALADHVIDNDGDRESTRAQVRALARRLGVTASDGAAASAPRHP